MYLLCGARVPFHFFCFPFKHNYLFTLCTLRERTHFFEHANVQDEYEFWLNIYRIERITKHVIFPLSLSFSLIEFVAHAILESSECAAHSLVIVLK